jgi:hypothetical protein
LSMRSEIRSSEVRPEIHLAQLMALSGPPLTAIPHQKGRVILFRAAGVRASKRIRTENYRLNSLRIPYDTEILLPWGDPIEAGVVLVNCGRTRRR